MRHDDSIFVPGSGLVKAPITGGRRAANTMPWLDPTDPSGWTQASGQLLGEPLTDGHWWDRELPWENTFTTTQYGGTDQGVDRLLFPPLVSPAATAFDGFRHATPEETGDSPTKSVTFSSIFRGNDNGAFDDAFAEPSGDDGPGYGAGGGG